MRSPLWRRRDLMANTSRLNLYKPVSSDLVDIVQAFSQQMLAIDAQTGATICTSTTQPTPNYVGEIIFETDTGTLKRWNGSSWVSAAQQIPFNAQGEVGFVSSTSDSSFTGAYGSEIGPYLKISFFAEVGRGYLIRTFYNVGRDSNTEVWMKARIRIATGGNVSKTDTLLADSHASIDDKILSISAMYKTLAYYTPPVAGQYTVGLFLYRYSGQGTSGKFQGGSFNCMAIEDVGEAV